MTKFNYLTKKTSKTAMPLDAEKYDMLINSPHVVDTCDKARSAHEAKDDEAYDAAKGELPMALWLGYHAEGKRAKDVQTPTQYFYIDIDHATVSAKEILYRIELAIIDSNPEKYNGTTREYMLHEEGIRIVHETPSGGFRMVMKVRGDENDKENLNTIEGQIARVAEMWNLGAYGDVDMVVHDLARGSFIVKKDWHLHVDPSIWTEEVEEVIGNENENQNENKKTGSKGLPVITDAMRNIEFNGVPVAKIAEEYVESQGGVPPQGQRHPFYNELIKNFRNLCDSDARIVFAVLPLCEGTPEKRWSQCQSICKSNNTSMIPKDFYFWLKRRGYVTSKREEPLENYIAGEQTEELPAAPKMPPVFREFCSICPPDFVYPTVVALLPVMGTLTSYVKATYFDGSEQTTTFFSTIYAPPGSHKSFASRIVDLLMTKMRIRDEMNSIREQLWLVDTRTKGDAKDKPDLPHVMVRIMPAINSLPEFLEKMRDNKGYHMFTFAEEVDTFAKGQKAGGSGDKSDLFRCAWDNSLYGQSFKSANTFKGMVRLYYNILLTGTPGKVQKYYSNVEDGMVTRVSICEIQNQKYAKFIPWKKLTKRQMEVVDRFVERCDANSYLKPLENTIDDALTYQNNLEEYDKNICWRFTMRDKQEVDLQWMEKPLLDWLEKKRVEASLAQDEAKDVFRRRAAVKGFRLALLCTCCWPQVRNMEQAVIRDFVLWFVECDLQESLRMFGEKYNKVSQEAVTVSAHHQSLFEALGTKFTKNDIVKECMRLGIKSKVKTIIWRWVQDGVIVKEEKDSYVKKVDS